MTSARRPDSDSVPCRVELLDEGYKTGLQLIMTPKLQYTFAAYAWKGRNALIFAVHYAMTKYLLVKLGESSKENPINQRIGTKGRKLLDLALMGVDDWKASTASGCH